MYRYFRLVSIPFLFLSSSVLLALAVFFINTSYLEFTYSIIEIYHLEAKADVIKSKYLTADTYEAIKYIFISISLIIPLFSFYVYLHLEFIYITGQQFFSFLKGLYLKLKIELLNLSKTERYILYTTFLLLTLARVYFAFSYPMHIDEAFSYVFIVSKGWLATVSYYPGPNNHVAFLLLCAPFHFLFDNPEVVMRLPALLISTITSALFFLVIKKYLGFIFSYATVVSFSFSEYGMFYAVHGRGYFLMLLLFIVAAVSFIRSINLGSRYYFILFCAAASMGFYTIPIFAYPLASLLIAGFVYAYTMQNTRKIRWLFISGLLIFLLTTIMYFPIIITSGYQALIGNEWVKPLNATQFYQNILFYLADTPGTFYSLDIYGLWITLLNLFFWSWVVANPKQFEGYVKELRLRQTGIFVLSFYLAPLFMLFIQQVMPGTRTWLYLSLIEYSSLLLAIKIILQKWGKSRAVKIRQQDQPIGLVYRSFVVPTSDKKKYLLACVSIAFYACCMFFYIDNYTLNREKIYLEHPRVTEHIVEKGAKKILVTEDLYNVFLRYEAIKHGHHLIVDTEFNAQRLFYDYVIIKRNETLPEYLDSQLYRRTHTDSFVTMYKRMH